jgi:predicted RNA-binding protein with PIN domain
VPADGVLPPSADTFATLDSDRWAVLLPHVRAVLRQLDEQDLTPALVVLRDAPTSRLVGGPARAELCGLLAAGGPVWQGLVGRLAALAVVPSDLRWVLDPPAVSETSATPGAPGPGRSTPAPRSATRQRSTADERGRDRLREAREQRDRWQRRAEGAEARAERLERDLSELRTSLTRAGDELGALRAELAEADERQLRAVERERRRRDGELEQLRSEIVGFRRAEEDRRIAARRTLEARAQAEREAALAAEEARRTAEEHRATRVVPGRPTALPAGVAPETTEAARLLLHRGRLVVVDGYNVTLQHRKHLDLETQRSWLVGLLGTLVRQRGIRPVVVFDGDRETGVRPFNGPRGVEVRFSAAGVTADDEVVLAVEGTDEPVVVVTDDRELRGRVRVGGADLLGTRSFLGVVT